MKTSGTTEVLPLGKKQKYACNIIMGVLLIAAGVILILAGTGVIGASARSIAAPTVLSAFGLSVLISAIIAKNALSMWLAGVLLSCALPSVVSLATGVGYGALYPIYIASPAVGCCFAIWFAELKLPQIKGIAFFGSVAAIFALRSSGLCGWGLTCGLLAAFAGVCIIIYTVVKFTAKNGEENA